jgi:hypothetical protein
VAADRAIARYGRENVALWFADTSWEDDDLYRFVDDCMTRWGGELIRYRDGRTPLQIAEQKQLIPNQMIAPCSTILKTKPFIDWLSVQGTKPTVLLGLNWDEGDRIERARAKYEAQGYAVDFPLLWKPVEYRPLDAVARSWDIAPPRLYGLGFGHNNCGGRCVKQGIAPWRLLLSTFPERFAEVRDWEQNQRAKGGARANRAIARDRTGGTTKPRTLAQIELMGPLGTNDQQADLFACLSCTE